MLRSFLVSSRVGLRRINVTQQQLHTSLTHASQAQKEEDMEDLKNNPYYSKYAEKLKKVQE